MFSSLSSFLPSALHLNNANTNENSPAIDVDDDEDDEQQRQQEAGDEGENENDTGKRKKKDKSPHETFIFVRPPPAKSNHPLNLQVQLVPPNSRQRRQSIDSRIDASDTEGDSGGVSLSRTPSVTSEASAYSTSGYGSTSSFASYNSTASTTTGRRMIIPLYNLQAHNVMTNTIVDAGTDAKIARFLKRGIEMIDLAILEPVEVWVTPSGAAQAQIVSTAMVRGGTASSRGSLDVGSDQHSLRNRISFLGRPGTSHSPGSSALSLSSAGGDHNHHHHELESTSANHANANTLSIPVPTSPPAPSSPSPSMSAPAKKGNIFGKLFDRKKKEVAPPGPSAPDVKVTTPNTPTFHSPTTPTPVPSPSSRHSRGLSSSFAGAFKKSSASPTPGSSTLDPNATPNPNNHGKKGGNGFLRPHTSSGIVKRPTSLLLGGNGGAAGAANVTAASEDEVTSDRHSDRKGGSRSSSRSRGGADEVHEQHRHQNAHSPVPTPSSSRFNNNNTGPGPTSPSHSQIQDKNARAIPTLPATLGITPTLSTPGGPNVLMSGLFSSFSSKGYPPPKELGFGKGPAMYVWVVRRWFKGAERSFVEKGLVGLGIKGIEGLPGGSSNDENSGVDMTQIEVRVEWKRGGRKKREKLREKKRREQEIEKEERSRNNSANTSRRSSIAPPTASVAGGSGQEALSSGVPSSSNTSLHTDTTTGEEAQGETTVERKKKNRLSTISIGSLGASSDGHGGTSGGGLFRKGSRRQRGAVPLTPSTTVDSDGEDSDPEDSETPWGCTVKVRRLVAAAGGGKSGPVKVKAGTLSPTPHHPKVVAMLKVPFPLPDVEVDKLNLRKREVGKVIPPANPESGGMVLTAEEIKDVICSTGLWVVVREGFGGVGKVSRKGDGWRIRA
ncbi:hypothetical protein AAF712_016040 [Marasmius tenuissimus]|uniref:Uncharacterized protein n=1 Tax=Marasmius tenuissimus TaxID=585030 RepID=A0ABR2Z7S5_9AGAR